MMSQRPEIVTLLHLGLGATVVAGDVRAGETRGERAPLAISVYNHHTSKAKGSSHV